MKVTALIVDDEPLARDVIEQYACKLPNLLILAHCSDAICAHDWLRENQTDLIFLDINMPGLSGISFLKSLVNAPLVIFTTAYSEYAIEGFELDVVDYLKKPFSFERFCKAFFKAEELLHLKQAAQKMNPELPEEKEFIFIRSNKKTYKINISEICYVEGLGDYIQVHLANQKIVSNIAMKKMLEILPPKKFIRIHKSFIIAIDKMELIEGNTVIINKKRLPIGNSYRQPFFDFLNITM
jgi:DNA-binding LytR/AlgR family response regulator